MKKYINFLILTVLTFALSVSLNGCQKLKDFHKPVDLRKTPLDPDAKARKNIEEIKQKPEKPSAVLDREVADFPASWEDFLRTPAPVCLY